MCGLFGFYQYNNGENYDQKQINKKKLMSILGNNSTIRGTHATGISYINNSKLMTFKQPLPAFKFKFNITQDIKACIGHTRHTTKGTEKNNFNNHPFNGKISITEFALAHNGMIYNDEELRITEKLPKTKIQTDSYITVQLLQKEKELTINSIKNMAEKLEGSFTLTILDNDNTLYIVVQDSPFIMAHFPANNIYIYASTKEILQKSLKEYDITGDYKLIEPKPGDILTITQDGKINYDKFDITEAYDYYPYYYCSKSKNKNSHYNFVCDYATQLGITDLEIQLLIDYGYELEEIETLLNNYTVYDALSDIESPITEC